MASPWASVNDIIMVLRRYTLAPKKAKRPSHLESFNYSRLRIYVNETGVKTDEQSDIVSLISAILRSVGALAEL